MDGHLFGQADPAALAATRPSSDIIEAIVLLNVLSALVIRTQFRSYWDRVVGRNNTCSKMREGDVLCRWMPRRVGYTVVEDE